MAGIAFARQSFQGQGQVTDTERKMIAEATGQRGTMTTAATVKMLTAMRDVQQRKIDIYRSWSSNEGNVQGNYKSFSEYVGYRIDLANEQQKAAAAAASGDSGSADPGANPELEDALTKYGTP